METASAVFDRYWFLLFKRSEHDHALGVLLLAKHEGLASLDHTEALCLALGALELEHDLLGVLCLLSEDGLGLSTETLLLHVISSLTLSSLGGLTSLVLGDFVSGMLLELPAISSNRLWDMHHLAIFFLLNNNQLNGEPRIITRF